MRFQSLTTGARGHTLLGAATGKVRPVCAAMGKVVPYKFVPNRGKVGPLLGADGTEQN